MQDEKTGSTAEAPDEPRVHDADYATNTMADRTSSVPERTLALGRRQSERAAGGGRGCHENRESSERR
eukprot:5907202-Pyramimonas_sp.AAC.1